MNWDSSAGRCANGVACTDNEDKILACSLSTLFDDSIKHDITSPIVY